MPSPAEDAGSGAADPGGESRDLAGDGGDHVVEAGPEDAGGGDGGAGEDGDEDRVFQHRGAGLSRFASRSAHGVGVSSACPRPLRGRFMVRDADRLPQSASDSGHVEWASVTACPRTVLFRSKQDRESKEGLCRFCVAGI